jgi:hypothetical protein
MMMMMTMMMMTTMIVWGGDRGGCCVCRIDDTTAESSGGPVPCRRAHRTAMTNWDRDKCRGLRGRHIGRRRADGNIHHL